jgi:sugar/nucleoside kinase (ribokinase family)
MAEDHDFAECLAWGSVAGGLACLKPGAQDGVPKRDEIEARRHDIKVERF